MVFNFGQYRIDVDVDMTKNFYKNADKVSEGCSCAGCKNFEQAAEYLPVAMKMFFDNLGIDYQKACECYVNCSNSDGTLLYGGFYHICGTLLSGNSAWVEIDKNCSHLDENIMFKVTDDFQVSFQDEVGLLEEDFPNPVIQLEFLANIPWVLVEKCPY